MSKYDDSDIYTYPDSTVLKNLLGLKVQSELDHAEGEFVTLRLFELSEEPLTLPFDIKTLKQIHKKLFGDIYEWAGEFRTVDISKEKTRFANIKFIEPSLIQVFEELKRDNYLQGFDKNIFSSKAAYYIGEINAIHPFREGNGRTQRELINQLALNNGFFITWSKIKAKDILEATIKSFNKDHSDLEKIIRGNLLRL
jgi:cell filamentation protein